MAGSKRWFRYVTDEGVNYGLLLDESNTELVNPTAATTASVVGLVALPQGISPRTVTLQNAARTITRTCVVLTAAAYAAYNSAQLYTLEASAGFGVSQDTEVFTAYKTAEEKRRQPFPSDTALNDGDSPN